MLKKTVTLQTRQLLHSGSAIATFYFLLLFLGAHYIYNIISFAGTDVVEMYHPMRLLLLSSDITLYDGTPTFLFQLLYPFLVVCPAGFSLAKEYQSGEDIHISARIGVKQYRRGKLVSVFMVTAIIFTVPFLLELVGNCIAFPLGASGNFSNLSIYNEYYAEMVHAYVFPELYLFSPYLCALLGTLAFGVISGMFAVFTAAISSVVRVKYNIFLFLPVCILLNATVFFNTGTRSIAWYDFLFFFSDMEKNLAAYGLEIALLIGSIVLIGTIGNRRDCI